MPALPPAGFFERRRLQFLKNALDAVRFELDPATCGKVLDVGGGAGATTQVVTAGAGEVTVLEPKARARKRGRGRRPSLRFVDGSAESIPFEGSSFDAVIAVVSFHHFADPGKALREFRRVLKPGGRVVILEFHPEEARGPHFSLRGRHTHFLGPEALETRLRDAGFEDLRARTEEVGYIVCGRRPGAE